MSILIKNAQLNQQLTDIFIYGNIIKRVGEGPLNECADKIIDATGKAIIPGFINGHTHAAMTLFRGFGDDIPLEQWLVEKIWPYEKKLTEEDVYHATKLACLEMIKTGTTCFNDMYEHYPAVLHAVEEMGLRAFLGPSIFDHFSEENATNIINKTQQNAAFFRNSRISFTLAPHAIYTVSPATLQWINNYSRTNDLLIHIHAAETKKECDDSQKKFGLTPVRYLYKLGLLSSRLIIAHALYVDEDEINMLADNGVSVVHNPNSNLKLGSGHAFRYSEMKAAGINICIGTDGCGSSNNLDMIEAAKIAAFMQKGWRQDPTIMPASEILQCITENGAKILRLNSGKIAEGQLADICLIDLNMPAFTPNFNFESNLIYSASHGSCIDTVICDGKILMENHYVENEKQIINNIAKIIKKIF